jgi:hypothetical protein
MALIVRETITIDAIGYHQWNGETLPTSARIRLGIYNSDSYNQPSTLRVDTGQIMPVSTSQTIVLSAINETLTPGVYYLVFVGQGLAFSTGSVGAGEAWGTLESTFAPTGLRALYGIGTAYTFTASGALPATFPTLGLGSTTTGATQRVLVRIA